LSAHWGAESDYLASDRTRTYNPSVNRDNFQRNINNLRETVGSLNP
jgi:hypothetical protein